MNNKIMSVKIVNSTSIAHVASREDGLLDVTFTSSPKAYTFAVQSAYSARELVDEFFSAPSAGKLYNQLKRKGVLIPV